MPGPEAATYVKLMNTGAETCASMIEKLCRSPTFICPETNLLNFSSQKTFYHFYDELMYFLRKEIIQPALKRFKMPIAYFVDYFVFLNGAERNCYSSGRAFSTVPLNHVMDSSYLTVCKNAFYNQTADMLSCMWENKTLYMSSPYECAEDINVNPLSRQLDC